MATITLKLENISVDGVQVKLSDGSKITLTSNDNLEYSGEFENSTPNLNLKEIILGNINGLDTNDDRFFMSVNDDFFSPHIEQIKPDENIGYIGYVYRFYFYSNIPLNSDTTNITLKYNPIVDCYWNGQLGGFDSLIGKYVFFIHKNSTINNIAEYVFTIKNIDTIERKLSYIKNSQKVKEWTIKPQEEITFRFDFTAGYLNQSYFVDNTNDDVGIFGGWEDTYGFKEFTSSNADTFKVTYNYDPSSKKITITDINNINSMYGYSIYGNNGYSAEVDTDNGNIINDNSDTLSIVAIDYDYTYYYKNIYIGDGNEIFKKFININFANFRFDKVSIKISNNSDVKTIVLNTSDDINFVGSFDTLENETWYLQEISFETEKILDISASLYSISGLTINSVGGGNGTYTIGVEDYELSNDNNFNFNYTGEVSLSNKTISLPNLQRFLQNCDDRYGPVVDYSNEINIPTTPNTSLMGIITNDAYKNAKAIKVRSAALYLAFDTTLNLIEKGDISGMGYYIFGSTTFNNFLNTLANSEGLNNISLYGIYVLITATEEATYYIASLYTYNLPCYASSDMPANSYTLPVVLNKDIYTDDTSMYALIPEPSTLQYDFNDSIAQNTSAKIVLDSLGNPFLIRSITPSIDGIDVSFPFIDSATQKIAFYIKNNTQDSVSNFTLTITYFQK